MSNDATTTTSVTPTHLTSTQADDTSGRPSEGDIHSTQDRLTETPEMFSPTDDYKDLSLPEGLKECEENFASFKQLAAELKLPAETVQKLLQWEANTVTQGQQLAEAHRADILQKWTEQTKEMFGPMYQREVAHALQAADRFGGPALRQLLEVTGLGSHPVIVKTFHTISQQISEDISPSGKIRHHTDKTFAEALYGKGQ